MDSDYPSEPFTVTDIFDIIKGSSKYTKKYGNVQKGKYPVYSASNREPLTFINSFDFDGEYLTWATNGFAGYIKILSGKFSINADRGLLKPKIKDINIQYVKYILEPLLREIAKGRKGENGEDEFTKVYPTMIENIKIPIPIINHKKPDIQAQIQIAEMYSKIEELKSGIRKELNKISEANIEIV
jgi:hypothetical protein